MNANPWHTLWHIFSALVIVAIPILMKILPTDTLNLTLSGVLLLLEDWARHAAE